MPIHSQSPAQPAVPLLISARVLVSEDPFVSSFLRTILQRRGHNVVIGSAAGVSELLHLGSPAACVVITNRPEAFLEFAANIHLLYIAAAPDFDLASRFPNCRVLRKPFRNDELLEAVDSLAQNPVA